MDEIRALKKGLSIASEAFAVALAAQIAVASVIALGTLFMF